MPTSKTDQQVYEPILKMLDYFTNFKEHRLRYFTFSHRNPQADDTMIGGYLSKKKAEQIRP